MRMIHAVHSKIIVFRDLETRKRGNKWIPSITQKARNNSNRNLIIPFSN